MNRSAASWLFSVWLVASFSFACGGEPPSAAPDAGVEVETPDAGEPGADAGTPIGSIVVLPDPDLFCLNNCLTLYAGTERLFVAVVKDVDGNTLEGVPVTWSSSDEAIATVSANGVVTAKAEGATSIIAAANGIGGETMIQVLPAQVAKLTVTPASAQVARGATVQLSATAEDEHGNVLSDVPFSWTSANPLVATVDEQGLVTGVRGGRTVIQVSTSHGFATTWSAIEVTSTDPRPTGFNLTAIAVGGNHGCGVTAANKAYCWGWNYFGQLGVNRLDLATESFPVPEPVVTTQSFSSVSVNGYSSCALTPAGEAWCWGLNDVGQLGTHATIGDVGGTVVPYAVLGGHTFTRLSVGGSHTCGLGTDQKTYCWGGASDGQLGTGKTQEEPVPTLVAVDPGTTFAEIASGLSSTCALDATGKAYCWGRNGSGQLGITEAPSEMILRNAPVAVSGNHTFQKLALVGSHVCALDQSGAAWCWGENEHGQIGDGSTTDRVFPVEVQTTERFVDIAVGAHHSCGLQSDGEVYCWGSNGNGQLGTGTLADAHTPQKVLGGHVFQTLRAGANVNCGITTASEALCWGSSYTGESGGGVSGGAFVEPWPVALPVN